MRVYQISAFLATFSLLFSHFCYTFHMQYRIIPVSEIESSDPSFWQSPTWADILMESGQAREVFYYGDMQSTYLLVEIRSVWLGFFGAFSLGVSHYQIGSDWDSLILSLQKELKSRNLLFLQIEPIDVEVKRNNTQKLYKKFLTPYTRVLDLTLTEDEILAQMHEKWRYNIRTAIKRGVVTERADTTRDNIDIWMKLFSDTLIRDGFTGNSREYYEIFIRNLEKTNQWWLYFARFEGRVIAAGIFVFAPDRAIYYYGASSSESSDRRVFGSYLLQWEAIRIARDHGSKIYDYLGISSPHDTSDALAGVSFFKSRFGGKVVALPTKILYPLTWKYSIFSTLQRIKNLLKRR